MSKALNYIGIARMGGSIEIGEENSRSLVKAGKAKLMIVASDTSDGAKRRAEGYVFGCGTPLIEVPYTKQEISKIAGRPGCSMAAFRDLGLAKSFVQALKAEYGEKYEEIAARLERSAERAKVRAKTGNRRKSV